MSMKFEIFGLPLVGSKVGCFSYMYAFLFLTFYI